MPKRFLPTLMRRIIVLAMIGAIMAFGTHAVSIGGGIGPQLSDSAPPGSPAIEHGDHSHDDGGEDDRLAGDAHGHTHADHSHDTVASGGVARIATDTTFASWRVTASNLAAGRLLHPPDRPPRPQTVA